MAIEEREFVEVDPGDAGLPVGRGERLDEELLLRRVGRSPWGDGLVLELSHADAVVQLLCEPRDPARQYLAGDERTGASLLDDAGDRAHAIALAVRRAFPKLASLRFRPPTVKERLRVAPDVDWAQTLDRQPAAPKISDLCDERCGFCSSPRTGYADGSAAPPDDLVRDRIRRWAAEGHRLLQFVDREPTLNPRLASYVALAREAGFTHVRLNTNGVRLRDGALLDEYVAAGLTEVCFSLHAPTAEESDRITGRAGGFEPKLEAIAQALARPLRVVVNMVVTVENFHLMPGVGELLAARFGRGPRLPELSLSFVGPLGDAAGSHVLPRYEQSRPYLEETLARFPFAEVHPDFAPPPCTVSPSLRERVAPRPVTAPATGRTYLERCDGCRMRDRCGGIWTAYLDRFGPAAFHPVA